MSSWPKSPSKEFKAQLKAEITHRVVEQQNRTSQNSETRNTATFLRRPAWQMTFAGFGH